MSNRIVPTPGDGMRYDGCPRIAIDGGADGQSLTVTVTYNAGPFASGARWRYVELTFPDVLEFRWVEWEVDYDTHPRHDDDFEFALIEITDSAYVPSLRTEGARHFRMGVDDWGELNIIGRELRVELIDVQGGRAPGEAIWMFSGGGNTSAGVTVGCGGGGVALSGVLECRWMKAGLVYDDHERHVGDRKDGLLEIVDSAYVTAMDARGWKQHPGQLRDYDKPVRHFRFGLGPWGELNVIATGVAPPDVLST